MKLKTLKMIACAAIMALTLSVTACGGSDNAAETVEDSAAAEDESGAEDEAAPEAEDESGTEDEAAPEAEDESGAEDEAAPEAEAEDDSSDAAASGETLEDYFNDPTVKSVFEQQYASLSEQGMDASIEVKGNDFSVIIKFTDASMVDDTTADQLTAGLDAMESQIMDSVNQFDEAIGQPGACSVTMRYLDPDGNVLAEKTCSAN